MSTSDTLPTSTWKMTAVAASSNSCTPDSTGIACGPSSGMLYLFIFFAAMIMFIVFAGFCLGRGVLQTMRGVPPAGNEGHDGSAHDTELVMEKPKVFDVFVPGADYEDGSGSVAGRSAWEDIMPVAAEVLPFRQPQSRPLWELDTETHMQEAHSFSAFLARLHGPRDGGAPFVVRTSIHSTTDTAVSLSSREPLPYSTLDGTPSPSPSRSSSYTLSPSFALIPVRARTRVACLIAMPRLPFPYPPYLSLRTEREANQGQNMEYEGENANAEVPFVDFGIAEVAADFDLKSELSR